MVVKFNNSENVNTKAIGFWQTTYQSISVIAPAGAMAATMTGTATYALGALPLTFFLAAVAMAFTVNTTVQFSRHIASAGGFYNYVSQGWGPKAGILTGWLFMLSYIMIITNASLFVAGIFLPGLLTYFHSHLPSGSWIALLGLIYAFVLYFSYRGIGPSLKYSLWTGTAEIIILIVISLWIICSPHSHNTMSVFLNPHLALHGWSGVGIGLILAMFSMSGYSAAATFGEEVHQPHKIIRLAVTSSFLFSAGLFVLMSYALTVGWGPLNMTSFSKSSIPGVILVRSDIGLWMSFILILFILNSLLTGILAPLNSLVRMMFAFARDGILLPTSLKNIHQRYRSPYLAIIWATVLSFVISVTAGLILGPYNGFLVLLTISSIASFLAHIIANIALTLYFKRYHTMNFVTHVLAPIISSMLIILGLFFTIYPFPWPVVLGPIIVAIWIAIGVLGISRVDQKTIDQAGKINAS
ncbi:APC family permease [Acidithiobacillus sp. VAN18-2]|uniref:APC family permease n=1 Tax=Igneacidithiobacillus copahuensis TaxID=2724909 RepID=UPI001C07E4DE|nr:APC family permease [Acidithiobacillus sp. BN09-2]MBU2795326.1 APC family permease [Acidithiobacillus sp. VAN18-2]